MINVIMIRIELKAEASGIWRVDINRYIPIGMVAVDPRETKFVEANSPKDIAKLKSPATIILGMRIGNSILKNTFILDKPTDWPTCNNSVLRFDLEVEIILYAKGKAINVWAITITKETLSNKSVLL